MDDEAFGRVVLDASVLINLLASGLGREILTTICTEAVIVENAYKEVCKEPEGGVLDRGLLEELGRLGAIQVVQLGDNCFDLFLELVAANFPDGLDDGEASTIAYASQWGFAVVLDDSKARRIFRQRFGSYRLFSSIDLFRRFAEDVGLGDETLKDILFRTLQRARMRVLYEHEQWVRSLLGQDLAERCSSLRKRLR